jgi:hypothetical protein
VSGQQETFMVDDYIFEFLKINHGA